VQSLQRDNDFYKKLSPDLKNSLCFSLLYDYYDKFFYFFNDVGRQNFADEVFIRKTLTCMDCQIFINGSAIVEVGKQFSYLYFNYRNAVTLSNPFMGLNLVDLPEGSFFGDY